MIRVSRTNKVGNDQIDTMMPLLLIVAIYSFKIAHVSAFNQCYCVSFLQRDKQPTRGFKLKRPSSMIPSCQHLFSSNLDNEDEDDYDDTSKWINIINDNEWEDDIEDINYDSPSWSSFESSDDDEDEISSSSEKSNIDDVIVDDGGEAWIDAIQEISANEIDFMNTENERALKAQEMQEWGFSSEAIEEALGVTMTDVLEDSVLENFRKNERENEIRELDLSEVDLENVESHTTVEKDEETGEVIRLQNVYVDEVTCVGCTNCAMIAQSTFFMEPEHGRARVFQQWGDDDETIAIAIETCPVDCIHYIPYEELVKLEVERREQNINFMGRLTGEANGQPKSFSVAQEISGNMGSRCNNCPTRGCKNCPMFGVGLNPAFQEKDQRRLEKKEAKERKKMLERMNKSVDL